MTTDRPTAVQAALDAGLVRVFPGATYAEQRVASALAVVHSIDAAAQSRSSAQSRSPYSPVLTPGGSGVMADGRLFILVVEPVKSVFVNVFGGITACDAVANGIVGALKTLGDGASKPLVVRLDGNNVEEGRRILAEFNHPLVSIADTMDGAARKAAELAAK